MNLSINLSQILIGIINFFILYFVLKKVLFNPFIKIIQERRDKINNDIKENQRNRLILDRMKDDYNIALKEQERIKSDIIATYTNKAELEYNDIIEKAKIKGKNIEKEASKKAQKIKNEAIIEAQNEIADISVKIATKITGKKIDKNINDELINKFINNEENFNE